MQLTKDFSKTSVSRVQDSVGLDPADKPVVFFPALNSLRFFAATGVVLCHIERNKERCGMETIIPGYLITNLGQQSVNLFFVLSSFLLTYLLLTEARTTGEVNAKNFYIRRALRIWPLYLIIVLAAFFVVPSIAGSLFHPGEAKGVFGAYYCYPQAIWLYFLMLPNLSGLAFPRIVGVGQCWSIGVEEQFYLFWPLLVKSFWKKPVLMCASFLVGILILWVVFDDCPKWFGFHNPPHHIDAALKCGKQLALHFRFMWIGAVAAVILMLKKDLVSRLFYNPLARIFIVATIAIYFTVQLPWVDTACGVLFGILVLSLTDPKRSLMTAAPLVYLGTISYGIYMFHPLIVNVLLKPFSVLSPVLMNLALFTTVLPVTIAVSALSYKFYEKPFLNLKRRFSTLSTD